MRKAAYDSYKARFTREKSHEQLMAVYKTALDHHNSTRK